MDNKINLISKDICNIQPEGVIFFRMVLKGLLLAKKYEISIRAQKARRICNVLIMCRVLKNWNLKYDTVSFIELMEWLKESFNTRNSLLLYNKKNILWESTCHVQFDLRIDFVNCVLNSGCLRGTALRSWSSWWRIRS